MRSTTRPNIRPTIKVDKKAIALAPIQGTARRPATLYVSKAVTKAAKAALVNEAIGHFHITTVWAAGYTAADRTAETEAYLSRVLELLLPLLQGDAKTSELAIRRAALLTKVGVRNPLTVDVAEALRDFWVHDLDADAPIAHALLSSVAVLA